MARQSGVQGFVLPMVVFLIVVLAIAVIAISQLTVDNTGTNLQALQKTRAQLMNQSILDRAVLELVTTESCTNAAGLEHNDFPGLTAGLTCTRDEYSTSSTGDFFLWTVTSTTSSTGMVPTNSEYVWHQMTAMVELVDD